MWIRIVFYKGFIWNKQLTSSPRNGYRYANKEYYTFICYDHNHNFYTIFMDVAFAIKTTE